MNDPTQFPLLALYNRLMNERLYAASGKLSPETLQENKGAFFKSVIGTLNHILVGDILWLKRFASSTARFTSLGPIPGIPIPSALDQILYTDLETLRSERIKLDRIIQEWCAELTEENLRGSIEYRSMKGVSFRKPLGSLALHFFLHQVHHRGQATTLLSQEGVDFGATDLIEIVPDISLL